MAATTRPAELSASVAAGESWLRRHGQLAVVLPHPDADGLSAGVLLHRRTKGPVLHVDSPWDGELDVTGPAVIADWGVRPVDGPSEVLYVDHHTGPEPVEGTVVASEGTCTSVVAWELLGRPLEGAWLAALGSVGDLGHDALRRPDVPRAGSPRALGRLAALVTAPGRLRHGPVSDAFGVLDSASYAGEALADPRRATLQEALDDMGAARGRAMRVAPRVGAEAALIRFSEPARVHSLVATAWSRRLAPRVVVAANDGWRDGLVSFAARSAPQIDLRAWLAERYEPPAGAGDYGRGHAGATGGALTPEAFEDFAATLL